MRDERSDMSYWFPRLEATGVPVPKTHLINWPEEPILYFGPTAEDMPPVLKDLGHEPPKLVSSMTKLVEAVRENCDAIGYPCFLRTGQGSGKHDFKNCCYVESASAIESRIANLVEWSETVDMLGLSCLTWAVREYLPVEKICVLGRYGDMPLVPEVRSFISEGKVVASVPYWPEGAIEEGLDYHKRGASRLATVAVSHIPALDLAQYAQIVTTVARAFAGDGAWSLDLLWAKSGWWAIDMAEAHRSYGCPQWLGGRA